LIEIGRLGTQDKGQNTRKAKVPDESKELAILLNNQNQWTPFEDISQCRRWLDICMKKAMQLEDITH
jgi:hypothetical protein